MKTSAQPKIFAHTARSEFIGREVHVDRLMQHASGKGGGIALLSTPLVGTSELLRHVYDRLFTEAGRVIPFYFEFSESDRSALKAALRFVSEFLVQAVAFRRRDPGIIHTSPALSEVAELAPPADSYWIDRIVEAYSEFDRAADQRSFIRNSLSAPLRAAANGAPAILLIDGLHVASRLKGGDALVSEIINIFDSAAVPVVLAGYRRFLFGITPFDTLEVEAFTFTEAGKFVEMLAARTGIVINDQTRDLIAVQLGCRAAHINSLFAAASANDSDLTSFEQVQRVYTDEIFGGRIGRYYDAILSRALKSDEAESRALEIMRENLRAPGAKIPASYWRRHARIDNETFKTAFDLLHDHELIDMSSGSVLMDKDDLVLTDYHRGRVHLELDSRSRALVIGDALSNNVKRAPELMARHYRRASAIGLRELFASFDGRQISSALIDYGRFKDELKGGDDEKVSKAIREDNQSITLPRIVYTVDTSALYPELDELCDPERSAAAFGFAGKSEKDEIVWLAAEIESKLEAAKDIVEFWCDRLEMVAIRSDLANYQIWLISPEGFTPEALDVIRDRKAYGSSRKQVDLLAGILNADVGEAPNTDTNEYEIVVPMGQDTEMIAAHTVEEIAKRHGFPAKAVNQIKTALVEACINASEHSHSPDRRIHQRFTVNGDKMTITISNRGVRLADKDVAEPQDHEGRRGWGLKLIEGLMDDVRIEDTDDGTRITMVKLLSPATAQ